jgi:nicotinamidase/pyrazinamidase
MHAFHPARTGLLVIDAQRGFTSLCPAELPIPGGLEIVPNVNRLLDHSWARIDASQDWHPPNHRSFFGQKDNLYPPHCVAGSLGAEFLPGLQILRFQTIWRKCFLPDFEHYSVVAQHPGLPAVLRGSGVDNVIVCGLAANICVLQAACDLRRAGFRVLIAEDASAGVDVPAVGLFQDKAKVEGKALGIEYSTTGDILAAVAAGHLSV